jgi:hypothetical protein
MTGFALERPLAASTAFYAFAADGALLGQAVMRPDDPSQVDASGDVRELAQTLRALDASKSLTVFIHRPAR